MSATINIINNTRFTDGMYIVDKPVMEKSRSEIEAKFKEVDERIIKYRVRPENLLKFSEFILTDDGIATGATIRAALNVLRNLNLPDKKQAKIILAIPVAAREVFDRLKTEAEENVVLEVSEEFGAVGQFYQEFAQVDDSTVIKLLNKYRRYK